MQTQLLLSAVCLLTACADSTPYVKSLDACARPVILPSGWLSDAQVESLWRQDRLELLKCADKVEVLSGRKPYF